MDCFESWGIGVRILGMRCMARQCGTGGKCLRMWGHSVALVVLSVMRFGLGCRMAWSEISWIGVTSRIGCVAVWWCRRHR